MVDVEAEPEVLAVLEQDPTVPVAYSEMAKKWFERNKAPNVKLTVYPEALHDSWTQTYDNPEVWKWLFEQKKG